MDKEEIIRMAREVGIEFDPGWGTCFTGNVQIENFAALVAAAEREACAELCVKLAVGGGFAADCAAAIRARSKQ